MARDQSLAGAALARPPCHLGRVSSHGGKYRVSLGKLRDLGILVNTRGPTRATKLEADRDLAEARKCGSRREVLDYVRGLSRRAPGAAGARSRSRSAGLAQEEAPAQPLAPPAGEAPAQPLARRRLRGKAAAAWGVPARAAARVDSGRKRARPASGAASPPEAPPAAGAAADGGGGVAGGAGCAGAGGEQEAAAAPACPEPSPATTPRRLGGAPLSSPLSVSPWEHPGRADWGRVESGISGLLAGLSQPGPAPPRLAPLLSAGVCKFQILAALTTAQKWAHDMRCARCPSGNEDNVVRMLVRMGLAATISRDLLVKLKLPLKPFEVVGGDALRAELLRLIGRSPL